MTEQEVNRFLPLTETTYYILLALIEPLHGYAVMQKIDEISEGTVAVGPGTLYNAFSKLIADKVIVKVEEDDRRKFYLLTDLGWAVLKGHLARVEMMAKSGRQVLG